jgi:hypothetical protein
MRQLFVAFERDNDLCGRPFQATYSATLQFACHQRVIDVTQADALACYFSALGDVVAYEEHGLGDIAERLGEVLGMDLAEPDVGLPS